jgi:ABC-type transport system involved in multi-copper enzyme maturation permease subunit
MKDIFLVSNVVFKESIRHKIILSLIILSFLIILSSLILDPIALGERERLVKDAGLSTISLFSLLIIILSGTRLIYQEIEKKTIFIIITKPISRERLLLGKFMGLLLIIYSYSLVSSLFLAVVLFFAKIPFSHSLFYSLLLITMQSTLLSAIAIFFASFASPVLSGIFTLMAYISGQFINDIAFFIEKSSSIIVKIFIKFLMLIIPNFYYLDIKINAVNNLPVSANYMVFAISYTLIYVTLLLFASTLIFGKKEFY